MKSIYRIEGIGTEVLVGEVASTKEGLEAIGLNPREWVTEKIKETPTKVEYRVTRKPSKSTAVETPAPASTVQTEHLDPTAPEEIAPATEAAPSGEPSETTEKTEPAESAAPGPEPVDLTPRTVTIKRQLITEALAVANDVTAMKGSLPILSFTMLDTTKPGVCTVSATNLAESWRVSIPCDSPEPVVRCIPTALTLLEVKALPKDISEVVFTFIGETLQVNSRCELNTTDAAEYPVLVFPDGPPVQLSGLLEALRKVAPAISDDDSRYALTGARVDPSRGKVVATDGFRLHIDDVTPAQAPSFTVPRQAVKIAVKHAISDEFTVAPGEAEDQVDMVSFPMKGGLLVTKCVQGNFPDYQDIVPPSAVKLTFSSKDFLQLLDGANPLSKQSVRLKANGSLSVEAESETGASYSWQIPCETEGAEGPFTLAFNPKFLIDALKSFQYETTVMEVPASYGACTINKKAVVMPIRA